MRRHDVGEVGTLAQLVGLLAQEERLARPGSVAATTSITLKTRAEVTRAGALDRDERIQAARARMQRETIVRNSICGSDAVELDLGAGLNDDTVAERSGRTIPLVLRASLD